MTIRNSKEGRNGNSDTVLRFLFSFQFSIVALRTSFGLIIILSTVIAQGQSREPDQPFRFAFSSNLMQNVNENDARASVKFWTKTLVKNSELRANPDLLVFHDPLSIVGELEKHTIDGVAMRTCEFMQIHNQVKFDRHLFGVMDGSITDEYILLVNADDNITKLEDLQGRSLNILRHSQLSVALPWLDTLLLQKGLKAMQSFMGQVNEVDKLVKTVLPVFFRKVDACLVTRKGFNAMEELNPQLGRQLRVLATSPKIVAGGLFLPASYPHELQDKFVDEVTQIHLGPSGHQILAIFQTERLEEHPVSVMDSTLELLVTHKRLLEKAYKGTASKGTASNAAVAATGGLK